MLRLDHLVVRCAALDDGCAWVQAVMGLPMAEGGKHPHMGTHNRLLRLGDLYLEVIAIDPQAPAPAGPRWFDLDHFAGPPRLTNWVAACDDLDASLAMAPAGTGRAVALARGDLRWRMAVPEDGRLPFDGAFAGLIQWQGAHPARRLPDSGARLLRLELAHPDADALRRALSALDDPRVVVTAGPVALRAQIDTSGGARWI